jgi:hypothetical protein
MSERADPVAVGRGDLDGTVVVAGALVLALGVALGVIRFVGGSPAERGVEGALAACALGAVIAAPGALALLARFDRPALLVPAGVLLMPLSGVSMAGATLPLLIPAVMLLVAYGRRRPHSDALPAPLVALLSAVVIMLVIAALVSLFIHEDPRSWVTPAESGATSDVVTIGESLVSLLLVGAALVVGWRSAAPVDDRARRPSS